MSRYSIFDWYSAYDFSGMNVDSCKAIDPPKVNLWGLHGFGDSWRLDSTTSGNYTLTKDLPGILNGDIELKVFPKEITVEAYRYDKDGKGQSHTFKYAPGFEIDSASVKAYLKNGVFTIEFSRVKKEAEKPAFIRVPVVNAA